MKPIPFVSTHFLWKGVVYVDDISPDKVYKINRWEVRDMKPVIIFQDNVGSFRRWTPKKWPIEDCSFTKNLEEILK